MLTPKPFPLKLIIMGNNQVAFDAVCCQIIGVDPRTVDHIRLAEERGFGTCDLAKIKVIGDVTLDEAKARAKGFEVGLIRVEKYFEGTRITAYAGPPPESELTDYCWGGCPGAIEEAIEILRLYDKELDSTMQRLHVVFGAYRGRIDAKPGEKVVFIGDCANWEGNLGDKLVQVRSVYKERATKDPHHARHDDIFAKMVSVKRKVAKAKKDSHVRLEGCPVSVAEQVLAIVELGKTKNPYLNAREAMIFNKAYFMWRLVTMAKRLIGKKYQVEGPCPRGHAMPEVKGQEHPHHARRSHG
jgi:hypothetical protein